MAILLSIFHSAACFEVKVCPFCELGIEFESEDLGCTEALSRSQRTSRATCGVEHSTILVNEHPEEVAQYWFGFNRQVLCSVRRRSIRIADRRNDLAVSSSSKETRFI